MKAPTLKSDAVLIIGCIVAVGQFATGWITTGQPDANLLEAAATAVGAVVTRYFVFSEKTVNRIKARHSEREQALQFAYDEEIKRLHRRAYGYEGKSDR